jgi:hypothetical protein
MCFDRVSLNTYRRSESRPRTDCRLLSPQSSSLKPGARCLPPSYQRNFPFPKPRVTLRPWPLPPRKSTTACSVSSPKRNAIAKSTVASARGKSASGFARMAFTIARPVARRATTRCRTSHRLATRQLVPREEPGVGAGGEPPRPLQTQSEHLLRRPAEHWVLTELRTGELRNLTICPLYDSCGPGTGALARAAFVDSRGRIRYSHDVSKGATYTVSRIPD